MVQTSQPVEKPVSAVLSEIIQAMPAEGLTLRTLLEWLGERGLLIFCMVLTIPFLLPVSIPGTSTPFGLLIALNAVGLALHKPPWLPNRLMNRHIATHQLVPMLAKGVQLFARLERLIRPRLLPLTHGATIGRLNVMLLGFSGLLLTAPLPLPFSNTLPAYGVLLLAMGSLERDGYAVLAGYVMVLLTLGYFATVGVLGGMGATALSSFF
jgi:hypothetical protein